MCNLVHNRQLYTLHQCDVIPFPNPFGCSVLHCGHPGCTVSFIPDEMENAKAGAEWTPKILDKVRQARAKHLIEVFGITSRFETNQTGLPEPTMLPVAPSSLHTTLHISFARAWAGLSVEGRRGVVCGDVGGHVDAVVGKVCESGRGDVFNERLEGDVSDLYPSFFEVLREALVLQGRGNGCDLTLHEHDFEENRMALKIAWELKAASLRGDERKEMA